MKTFQHILVPTDFSPSSEAAIEVAITLAQRFKAELTLLHVWQLPVYPYMQFMVSAAETASAVERDPTNGL